MNRPYGIVVDITPVIDRFRQRKELYPIYNLVSLTEILDLILRSFYDTDFFDILNNLIDIKLEESNNNDYIDIFLRDTFINEIFEDLESYLQEKCQDLDYSNYKLAEWINHNTVLLLEY